MSMCKSCSDNASMGEGRAAANLQSERTGKLLALKTWLFLSVKNDSRVVLSSRQSTSQNTSQKYEEQSQQRAYDILLLQASLHTSEQSAHDYTPLILGQLTAVLPPGLRQENLQLM